MAEFFQNAEQTINTARNTQFFSDCTAATVAGDTDWDLQLGSGMTATAVQGTINGVSYYEFAAGTTTNSSTIFLCKRAFRLPANIKIAFDRSVAGGTTNQNAYVEFVEVDPTLIQSSPTTAVVTSGTDTNFANARNGWQLQHQPSSSSILQNIRRSGLPSFANTAGQSISGASAPTGSSPNFIPGDAFLIQANTDVISLVELNTQSTAPFVIDAPSVGTNTTPTSFYSTVDPTKWYALRIRIVNGGSAPAASIIYRLYRVFIQEVSPVAVDFYSSPNHNFYLNNTAGTSFIRSIPVTIRGNSNSTIPVSFSASQLTTVNSSGENTENGSTVTPLGISATYNSSSVSPSSFGNGGYIVAMFTSDQASAVDGAQIQISDPSGSVWYTPADASAKGTLVANQPLVLSFRKPHIASGTSKIGSRVRISYTNGAVAQTVFSASFQIGQIA